MFLDPISAQYRRHVRWGLTGIWVLLFLAALWLNGWQARIEASASFALIAAAFFVMAGVASAASFSSRVRHVVLDPVASAEEAIGRLQLSALLLFIAGLAFLFPAVL